MAQAKKKSAAKKTTAKKPVKRASSPARSRRVAATGHADDHAKSLVAWAVLGLVVVAFAMWILSDYKNMQENFNNVNEGSSMTNHVHKQHQD